MGRHEHKKSVATMKQLNMLTPRIFHRDVCMACALSRQMCQDYNCDQLRAECAPPYTGTDQEPAQETSNA